MLQCGASTYATCASGTWRAVAHVAASGAAGDARWPLAQADPTCSNLASDCSDDGGTRHAAEVVESRPRISSPRIPGSLSDSAPGAEPGVHLRTPSPWTSGHSPLNGLVAPPTCAAQPWQAAWHRGYAYLGRRSRVLPAKRQQAPEPEEPPQYIRRNPDMALTNLVLSRRTLLELEQLIYAQNEKINHITAGAAVTRLAGMADEIAAAGAEAKAHADDLLLHLSKLLARRKTGGLSRQTAALAFACAKVGAASTETIQLARNLAVKHANYATPVDISQIAWSFSKLGAFDRVLATIVAHRVIFIMPSIPARNLSNILWAYATAGLNNKSLLEAAVPRVLEVASDMEAQHSAVCAWSFARLQLFPKDVLSALLGRLQPGLSELDDQLLSTAVWACARARVPEEFFEAVQDELERRAPQLSAEHAARLIWALAYAGRMRRAQMPWWRQQVLHELERLNPQDLVMIAYALARLHHKDAEWLEALCTRARVTLDNFSPVQLSLLLNHLAFLGAVPADLAYAAALHVLDKQGSYTEPALRKAFTILSGHAAVQEAVDVAQQLADVAASVLGKGEGAKSQQKEGGKGFTVGKGGAGREKKKRGGEAVQA